MGLSNNLRTLGDDIIVRKMLDVVPEHLEQVAISIETLLDLNTVSVKEVTERLHTVEQRRRKTTPCRRQPRPPSPDPGGVDGEAEDWGQGELQQLRWRRRGEQARRRRSWTRPQQQRISPGRWIW
jgi:hypothetical protein